jgi:enterochelin esterase-like enzyme
VSKAAPTLILDNLIAANRIRPFIVVMIYGMTNETRFGGLRNFDIGPFETVLVDEVIPFIDANFRTLPDQPHRAMAGLSMGGMETKMITLRHPGQVLAHWPLQRREHRPDDISDMAAFKAKNKLVFVSYGSREERGATAARESTDALKQAGINSHYLRVARDGSRVAVLAAQPLSNRPVAVPETRSLTSQSP